MDATEPIGGEFFDPDPASCVGPDPAPKTIGPALVELGRLGTRTFRLCRRIGYRDPETREIYVIPRDLNWTCDLSSNPPLFSWIVPVLGAHFNAVILHDCLVEETEATPAHDRPGAQGSDYIGRKVAREEADRIARDAMGELGAGFLLRWIAWAGMITATAHAEGLGGGRFTPPGPSRKWTFRLLLWAHVALLLVLGIFAILDLVDVVDVYPWMGLRPAVVEIATGLCASILIPMALAFVWWDRWQYPMTFGLIVAPLLPAVVATGFFLVVCWLIERIFSLRRLGLVRQPPCDLDVEQLCTCEDARRTATTPSRPPVIS